MAGVGKAQYALRKTGEAVVRRDGVPEKHEGYSRKGVDARDILHPCRF